MWSLICLPSTAVLLALASTLVAADENETDWCKYQCPGGVDGTMCTWKTDAPSENCVGWETGKMMTVQDKQDMIAVHNHYRHLLLRGEVEGQPTAKEMYPFRWSLELEQQARRWALQCHFAHDVCRKTRKDGIPVSQNLAWTANAPGTSYPISYISLVDWMWEEYKDYPPTGNGPFHYAPGTAHYTNMAWAKIKYIGCEGVTYATLDERSGLRYPHAVTVVCNYWPPGNYPGAELYFVAPPGTKGVMLDQAPPREGESGYPEDTVLIGVPPGILQAPKRISLPPPPALTTATPPPPRRPPQPPPRREPVWKPTWKTSYVHSRQPKRYPGRANISCDLVARIRKVFPKYGTVQEGRRAKPIECQGSVAPGIPADPGQTIIAGGDK